jgi:anti-anti-sigma regulatory factor
MLRISQIESVGQPRILHLEGQVSGPWVEELKGLCDALHREGRSVILDFSQVSFLDQQAISLVRILTNRQVRIQNCSPFIAEQLKGVAQCQPNLLDSGRQHV